MGKTDTNTKIKVFVYFNDYRRRKGTARMRNFKIFYPIIAAE